jgi:hypothetical protein
MAKKPKPFRIPYEAMSLLVDIACSTAKGVNPEEFHEQLYPDEVFMGSCFEDDYVMVQYRKMQDDFAGWFRGLDLAYKLAFMKWAVERCGQHVTPQIEGVE